jgi:hypothetical protein
LQQLRAWVFLARWQDLATIPSQLTKAWVDLVNQVLVQVDHVQLVQVVHHVQVVHLVLLVLVLVLVDLLVQVDLLHVQAVHLLVLQVVLQVLVLQVVVQVLVVVVAVAVRLVLSVRVDLVTLQRLESQRE